MKYVVLIALVTFGFLSDSAEAATSIATVSLDKVYNGYWKTDQENDKLKKKQKMAQDKIKGLNQALTKDGEVLSRMIKALNDPNLSAAEKTKRQQQAGLKQQELRQQSEAIQAFSNATSKDLELEMRKARDGIMEEIQQVVAAKARAGGFDLVLDKAGKSAAIAPIVVYSADGNDLTESVLKQLNLSDPKKGSGGKK
ncbi:MAG: OmpH family outer membrane protein [Verrucomicrobiota bacterium]|nr:OmpH family outer membrane protein [Verrucomicrobiota bacterium]